MNKIFKLIVLLLFAFQINAQNTPVIHGKLNEKDADGNTLNRISDSQIHFTTDTTFYKDPSSLTQDFNSKNKSSDVIIKKREEENQSHIKERFKTPN